MLARRTGLPLLADPYRHLDRGALEAELLAQAPLNEPPVGLLEEPGSEQHDVRGPGTCLRGEEDLRGGRRAVARSLLDEPADPGVERPVGMRRSQLASAVSRAGTSFATLRPVAAEMFTRGAQRAEYSARSISTPR